MERRKSDLVAEALELSEAAALEAFGVVAVEVFSAEVPVGGLFAEQVVGDLEDVAPDGQYCSSMPYMSAQATIARSKGGVLGAAGSSAGLRQCGANQRLPRRVLPLRRLPALS